jgi:hypothetical protein
MYLYFETHFDYRDGKKPYIDNIKLLNNITKHTNSSGIWGFMIENKYEYLYQENWVDIKKYETGKKYNNKSEENINKILNKYYYRSIKIKKLMRIS